MENPLFKWKAFPITITFSDVYLCNYPSFGIHSSHLDENGSGNRTGACDDDNLLTSLIIDRTLVMFNLMQFHSLIRLCSRLFVRFLVLSFLPSFILTTEGFKSFAQIHITESDCRIT